MDQALPLLKTTMSGVSRFMCRVRAWTLGILLVLAILAALEGWRRYAAERRRRINRGIVYEAAQQVGISPSLLAGVAEVESRWDDKAVSRRGAVGLLQVMPVTAMDVAGRLQLQNWELTEPRVNALIGATYLKMLLARYREDRHLALAAYHAGPQRVTEWRNKGKNLPGPEVISRFAFKETQRYVLAVERKAEAERLQPAPRISPPASAH